MKGIVNFVKKYDIDIIVLTILIMALFTFFCLLNYWDELWNFANSYKIFQGYKIYQDINIIVTPLFFYFAQIFLKIFGTNMLAYRIYNVTISSTFMILIYKIFKELKITRRRAIFYTLLIEFIIAPMVAAGANYNMLALLPILLNLLLILKKKEKNILTGVLLFLTFMVKQNIGIYFAIGIFAYKIVMNGLNPKSIISILKIDSIFFIGILIFLVYMYLDGNLYPFINYCFLGIAEFGERNLVISFYEMRYLIIAIMTAVLILFLINYKKTKSKIEKEVINHLKILLCLGIPMLFISYPIFNNYHSTLASIILIIGFLYFIESIFLRELLNNRKKEIALYGVIMITYLIYMCINRITALQEVPCSLVKEGPYRGSIVTQKDIEDMDIICKFIKEKEKDGFDVKILSYKANLYMTLLGKNNGIFDLPLLGNFGKNGEKELINQINHLKNTFLLIQTNNEETFFQESEKAREYIINHYQKIGEIQEYSIYLC